MYPNAELAYPLFLRPSGSMCWWGVADEDEAFSEESDIAPCKIEDVSTLFLDSGLNVLYLLQRTILTVLTSTYCTYHTYSEREIVRPDVCCMCSTGIVQSSEY